MGRRLVLGMLLLGACKAELGGMTIDDNYKDAPLAIDSAPFVEDDAAVDSGDLLGPWGTAAKIPGADSTAAEDDGTLSSNKLELYFKRDDAGDINLYVMTRTSETSAWSAPTALTALNQTTTAEESPRLTSNDLTMYFGRSGDIYKSQRASLTSPWGAPTAVTSLNTGAYEKWAHVCDNGYAIVSRAVTNRSQDLFEGTITGGANTALDATINTTFGEMGTLLTSDCLHLYFQSNRDGTFDLFEASRATTADSWGTPVKLTDFNTTTYGEEDPWISTDERTFTFTSNASGNKDIYISTR